MPTTRSPEFRKIEEKYPTEWNWMLLVETDRAHAFHARTGRGACDISMSGKYPRTWVKAANWSNHCKRCLAVTTELRSRKRGSVASIQRLLSSLLLRRPWTTVELVRAQAEVNTLLELYPELKPMSSQEKELLVYIQEIEEMLSKKADSRELWDLELKRIGFL